jgi:hypothetical protein
MRRKLQAPHTSQWQRKLAWAALGTALGEAQKICTGMWFFDSNVGYFPFKSIACIVGDTIKIPAEGFPSGIFSYYISVG